MMKSWKIFILGSLFVLLKACGSSPSTEIASMALSNELNISLSELELVVESDQFEPVWEERTVSPGIKEFVLNLKADKPVVPEKMNIRFSFPSDDVIQYWNPGNKMDKVNYYYNSITSRASSNAPVLSFINSRNMNRLTVAVSEAMNRVGIYSELVEEDARFHVEIELFNEHLPAISEYQFVIRIDTRNTHFNRSLDEVAGWWAGMPAYKPAEVPDDAKHPMYSTWYSFHQNLDVPAILAELKSARDLGMTAVIVDDGWQTLDSNRGYAYTGDWQPQRIPQMKEFVEDVHALDMKFLLWYSLPFVGEKSDNFSRFKGKYLRYWESQGTYVLDPRYPEVREFIIQTYESALNQWGLDGFKLDFLGWFTATETTDLTIGDGRDIASVNSAVDLLMTEIMSRLKEIEPEIMIEFRQPYIGPLMRKYGNMFRATDCPNMAVVNRVRTTDIRMIAGNTAVHSDMFMWHRNDPVESAALQILNILFAVPQLSVRLDSLSTEQLEMARYYLSYWNENRTILLDGEFEANDPGALYPMLRGWDEQKEIIALYNEICVDISASRPVIDIINAKPGTSVVIRPSEPLGKCGIEIYNCMGELVDEYTTRVSSLTEFSIPPSGMVKIAQQ